MAQQIFDQKRLITKVLVANRGEIACRVIRTCKEMGIATVAVYSDADRDSMFVQQADEGYALEGNVKADTYLNIEKIVGIAKKAGADAVHPGYGFLSENGQFAQACESNNITFIGPLAETMALLGDKRSVKELLATQAASQGDVPLIPGYNGADQSLETLEAQCREIGCPVLVKASAGGGGKGMRVARDPKEMKEVISSVQREALSSFGSDQVLLEKYFDSCRHVEIQIFGDKYGTIIALGERDCSVQRRYQKVVEESPSPIMDIVGPELRERMCASAIAIGKLSNYIGAGTVEFLVEPDGKYYFLEVNTRLQVEHPITELVYGVDLVSWQVQVAQGVPIAQLKLLNGLPASEMKRLGHAVECRLYAEDPSNNYFPCTGSLLVFSPYAAEGMRYDTGVESGSEITVNYDPMIAKVISFGKTRELAIARMVTGLQKTVVAGVVNNSKFLQAVLLHKTFASGHYDTSFLGTHFTADVRSAIHSVSSSEQEELAVVGSLWNWIKRRETRKNLSFLPPGFTNGLGGGLASKTQVVTYKVKNGNTVTLRYQHNARAHQAGRRIHGQPEHLHFAYQVVSNTSEPAAQVCLEQKQLDSNSQKVSIVETRATVLPSGVTHGLLIAEINGTRRKYQIVVPALTAENGGDLYIHSSTSHCITPVSRFGSSDNASNAGGPNILAPMPSKIVSIVVKVGDKVAKGQTVIILESMKMELKVSSHSAGKITAITCKQDQVVKEGHALLTIETEA
mmetsp:Transcript_38157/g.75067  ORF Transcript_38157/g.75067 Transcript_38157/m.75067 type:complete len:740 (+) Transcript_38157:24-2243(+)|eukprot:CAMPEP_0175142846 /NCGR_PEP_ID=MMETSP0087-20121206/13058_1 /TAXON_ID=136419 /ORGANISM="Unknown Unknown, Strain D1" /LENGTH=739 /DNA_ID=CAMNT_0016426759 /DNA_START=22 /DNA_END=2241 /DNA_ORIENTATION=-